MIAGLIFTSCEHLPHADFAVSSNIVEVGENVYFYNNSLDANEFEWNFDNGIFSYLDNPTYSFTAPGFYEVQLAAFNEDGVDYAYQTIEVIEPETYLEIEVLEYYDKYPVEGASVLIYPTLQDWENETNMIIEVFTDAQGIAVVAGLDPRNYYVDVWHEYHDNYSLAEEDLGFIEVSGIVKGEYNYFTAWVDYYPEVRSAEKAKVRDRTRKVTSTEVKREYDKSRTK